MSLVDNAADPYAEPGAAGGTTTITAARPPGSDVVINDDGSVSITLPGEEPAPNDSGHFANLAETMSPGRLSRIAMDLLDAIDVDKESREKRDKQYEEGIRRTGLGDDAPGGASFPGASKVVHPVLTEACIDFAARIMNEMMPPEGPVKGKTVGSPTNDKDDKAERISRYMNLQLTELMPNVYYEFEQGFTECPLGGAFYTKFVFEEDGMSIVVIPIDKIHRPWSSGSIYIQPRITHEQEIDRFQYLDNVRNGLWVDVLNPEVSSDIPEQTNASLSNDRVVGRDQPSENIDKIRTVFESSVKIALEDDDAPVEPYLITVDKDTRKILSIYRNWRQEDTAKQRLDFVIEWPFWPWRGGYPIGMTHMIGGLSGAATGSLRALLDQALLSTVQSGVRLKGGATAGGQNVKAQPMQTTEIQGSLAQDDIRKTYMPLPFPPPSPVLFQLLGFVVDAARGVIRTTFDEYDKFNGQTPVGTANMFIEQGLKNLGAIHGRLHRSMRRFLKQLWDINARTVNNEKVQDDFGELIVTREDFSGPMNVVPVSDPRIFSDMQRQSMAQLVAQRATTLPQLYDLRKAELYFLKQMNVPEPEQFLQPQAQPVQQNAVAENTTAANGLPIKAYPGQDHEAHLATHIAFLQSPLFGSNPILAVKYLPVMLPHLAEHLALWYAAAMLESANAALRVKSGNPQLTIESLSSPVYEAPLDRLLAELSPDVLAHADQELEPLPPIIMQAQDLMKRLAPPQQMDPSAVAMADVNRQQQADEAQNRIKMLEQQQRDQQDQRRVQLDAARAAGDQRLKAAQLSQKEQADQRQAELETTRMLLAAHDRAEQSRVAEETNQSREAIAADNNQTREGIASGNNETQLEITRLDTESAETIADKNIAAGERTRLSDGGSLKK